MARKTDDPDHPYKFAHLGPSNSKFGIPSGSKQVIDDISHVAMEEIRRCCMSYVRMFGRALSFDDRRDIVEDAIVDWYSIISKRDLSHDEAEEEIRKALERHRKSATRHAEKNRPLEDQSERTTRPARKNRRHDGAPRRRPAGQVYLESSELEAAMEIIEPVEGCVLLAINLLSSNDRHEIVTGYLLGDLGIERQTTHTIGSGSSSASAKRLYRARKRFNRFLESLLEKELRRKGAKPEDVSLALSVVRGKHLVEALEAAREVRAGREAL